jgi:cytochrome c
MSEKFGSRKGAWALPWIFVCAPVMAADPAASLDTLAQSSGCMSCHAKAEKIVGPAFVSIADKYKGDKDAGASLAQSIQNGSRGKWGRVPMPAHPSLSQADLKTLAQWVLATKP